MNETGSPLFGVLFFVFYFIAITTSLTVSSKNIWIPVVFCVLGGASIGIYSAGIHPGLFRGMIAGLVFAVLMIPGMQLTKYFRKRALRRLKEDGIDLEGIFKKH